MLIKTRFLRIASLGFLVLIVIVWACKEEGSLPQRAPFSHVLVIGNSITFHPPAPEIGWNKAWGMAASKPENDFFSILTDSLLTYNPEIQTMRQNVYPFEKFFGTVDFADFADIKSFGADLLIVRLGENVDTGQVEGHNFAESLIQFVNYLKGSQDTEVVVTTMFWPNPIMNEQVSWAAKKEGWKLVDITFLSEKNENMAIGEYADQGVASHPGDQGMREIARLIWEGLAL